MIGIYKIENIINGKKYIGQSVDIHARILDHKRINERSSAIVTQTYPLYLAFKKYGLENFSFEVIEECSLLQLDEREIYWIDYYHSFIKDNGYNLTRGGAGNQQINQEEINNFIKLWEQGLSVGEIVAITGRNNHIIIKYLKANCDSYNVIEGDARGRIINGKKHCKAINQYDLTGKFIKQYDSVKKCAEAINGSASSIISNAKYKTKSYHNSYFIYANENQIEGLMRHKQIIGNARPVIQKDLKGNILNYFESASAAGRYLGHKDGNNIISCCNNKSNSAYGYHWEYL